MMFISALLALPLLSTLMTMSQASHVVKRDDMIKRDVPMQDGLTCSPFDYKNKDDNTHWVGAGWIDRGPLNNASGKLDLQQDIITEVKEKNWKFVHFVHYTYTFKTGNTEKGKKKIYIESRRSTGKGLGQQFRVKYWDVNGNELGTWWMMPNQHCTTDVTFDPTSISSVSVDSRNWLE